ncbi:MAG: DUF2723 domain-containing protein [Candidatus Cloacimonetes bacterium]|nr:DUF2723 domain-containing protein [Candidatus Cloacimonadota bacterium]
MTYKPQAVVNKKHNALIATLVFLGTLLVYYFTHARSLSFWDAGEYITCSSIFGVPHPPGNPFYIILGRFFSIFNFGFPHAQVINFLSSILSAFAVMFTYLFTVQLVSMWASEKEAFLTYCSGIIAAVYIAFSFTFWNNAIEAEVYAGLAFTINIITWLTLLWVQKSRDMSHQNILLLIIYIFFLGFGIHQTSLQIGPAVLFIVVYPMLKDTWKTGTFWTRLGIYIFGFIVLYLLFFSIGTQIHIPDLAKYALVLYFSILLYYHFRGKVSGRTWLFAIFLVVLGLSPHLFLLIRSEFRPFINEGSPHNMQLFTDYVLRRQYGPTSMFHRRASFFYQMYDQFLTYFSWQFFNKEMLSRWLGAPQFLFQLISNLIVTLLGVSGMYYQFKKNRHSFAYLLALFFMASVAMVFVINLSNAEVRERDYFFTTAYNYWAVWMGIGSIGLVSYLRKRSKSLASVALVIVLALPLVNLASQYFPHDRSREYIALGYGQNILNSVEENAIIFTNGDNDTFPVWYAQAVADPAAEEYIQPRMETVKDIHNNTIPEQQIVPTKTTLALLEKARVFKNDQCSGIRKDVTIANLSLLNTPWYIKQLRDHEGVEFNIPDKHIDLCQESRASVLFPRQLYNNKTVRIKGATDDDTFSITLKKGRVLYVKDLAVLQIIKDNYGKRPIYFAVTVPDVVGFEEHLRNEGMVDRLVATRGKDQFNIQRLTANIDSVYTYKGILDDSIYKDKNMQRLLNNYGAAFMRTSQYFHAQGNYGSAIEYMEKAMQYIQDKKKFYPGLSQLYVQAGLFLLEHEMVDEAFEHFENAVYYNRDDKNMVAMIYEASTLSEAYDKGITLLNKMAPYVGEEYVQGYIDKLQAKLPTEQQ